MCVYFLCVYCFLYVSVTFCQKIYKCFCFKMKFCWKKNSFFLTSTLRIWPQYWFFRKWTNNITCGPYLPPRYTWEIAVSFKRNIKNEKTKTRVKFSMDEGWRNQHLKLVLDFFRVCPSLQNSLNKLFYVTSTCPFITRTYYSE